MHLLLKHFSLILFLVLLFIPFAIADNEVGVFHENEEEAAQCAGCAAYKCMDNESAHCGTNGYLMAYGEPNCERFGSKEIYGRFDRVGKKFINCTRDCLINFMERYILEHTSEGPIDCAELKVAGFNSHQTCYLSCGFCNVCKTNKWALLRAYRPSDFFSLTALRQVAAVMHVCGLGNCLFGGTNR